MANCKYTVHHDGRKPLLYNSIVRNTLFIDENKQMVSIQQDMVLIAFIVYFQKVKHPGSICLLFCSLVGLMISGCAKETSCENCSTNGTGNNSPIANAGADQTVKLPNNTVILDGSGSSDPDNDIVSYTWSKIAGPAIFSFANANALQTPVSNLQSGTYLFALAVKDATNLLDTDTVQITVTAEERSTGVYVYVAGQSNDLPVYWKNGEMVKLTNGALKERASSIAVVDTNVYVAGMEYLGNTVPVRYWINNKEHKLEAKPGRNGANAIAVHNGDVYVAGWEHAGSHPVAMYWKNGKPVPLTDGSLEAYAYSMAIANGNIYVAGEEGGYAKYWKNGEAVPLVSGNYYAAANAITVVGNDVYVAGTEFRPNSQIARSWENGALKLLTNTRYLYAIATSICRNGNDTYVAGWECDYFNTAGGNGSVAKYWKNGVEIPLSSGNTYAYTTAITVFEGDVYVAGREIINGRYTAKYWKNGKSVQLSDNGSAYGIAVLRH